METMISSMGSSEEDAWFAQQAEVMRQHNLIVAARLVAAAAPAIVTPKVEPVDDEPAHVTGAGSVWPAERADDGGQRADKRPLLSAMFDHSPELAQYDSGQAAKRRPAVHGVGALPAADGGHQLAVAPAVPVAMDILQPHGVSAMLASFMDAADGHALDRGRNLTCDLCRKRKIKCSRQRPCSHCAARGLSAQCNAGPDDAISIPKTDPDGGELVAIQRPLGSKASVEITQDATAAYAKAAIGCQLNPMLMVRMAEVCRVTGVWVCVHPCACLSCGCASEQRRLPFPRTASPYSNPPKYQIMRIVSAALPRVS